MKIKKSFLLVFSSFLLFTTAVSAQTQYLSAGSTIRDIADDSLQAVKTVAYEQARLISLYLNGSDNCYYFCRTSEGTTNVEYGKILDAQLGSFIHRIVAINDFGIIGHKLYFCGRAFYMNDIRKAFVACVDVDSLFAFTANIKALYFRDIDKFDKLDIVSEDRLSLIADSTYYYDLTYSTGEYTKHSYSKGSVLKDIIHTNNYICVLSRGSDTDITLYRHLKTNTSNFIGMQYVLNCANTNYRLSALSNDKVIVGYGTQDLSLGYMTTDLSTFAMPSFFKIQDYPKMIDSLTDMVYTTYGKLLMLSYSYPYNIISVIEPSLPITYTTYSFEPNILSLKERLISITDFGNNRFATFGKGLYWYDNVVANIITQCHTVVSTIINKENCLNRMVEKTKHLQSTTTAPVDTIQYQSLPYQTYNNKCQ